MATGDIKWFASALLGCGNKLHNLSSDVIKFGIIKSAANGGIDPTLATADPCWGAGGSTNLSTSQVVTTGTSYTGPAALATVTWTTVSNVPTFRAGIVTLAQDAAGFTNGRWVIIFNDTATNKNALGFCDLGSDRSLVTGQLVLDWSGATNDILTLTQS